MHDWLACVGFVMGQLASLTAVMGDAGLPAVVILLTDLLALTLKAVCTYGRLSLRKTGRTTS